MGLGIVKSLAGFLLLLNFCMYVTVAAIAGWALNKAIDHHYVTGPKSDVPVGFSSCPLSFPIGNEATGFMVIFSLIAGVAGAGSCLSGLHHLRVWTAESLASTVSSAIASLGSYSSCHGIALEGFIIILSATKLFYMMVIHIGFFAGNYFFGGEKHVATTSGEPVKENT